MLLNSIINRSSRIHKTNVWGYQPKQWLSYKRLIDERGAQRHFWGDGNS